MTFSDDEETDDYKSLAEQMLKVAPPDVALLAIVCLLDYGDGGEYRLEEGRLGTAFMIDTSVATRSGRVDPTFQAGAAAARQLADQLDARFKEAGYTAVSLNVADINKAGQS